MFGNAQGATIIDVIANRGNDPARRRRKNTEDWRFIHDLTWLLLRQKLASGRFAKAVATSVISVERSGCRKPRFTRTGGQ